MVTVVSGLPDIFDIIVKERKNFQVESLSWPGIYERSWQHEYAKGELRMIQEFQRALNVGSIVEIDGFVTRIGGRKILLRPTPASVDINVICEVSGHTSIPTDYDFIRIRGYRKFVKGASNYRLSNQVIVEEFDSPKLPRGYLKPDISLRDAADLLVYDYVDFREPLKTCLLLSIVSSPRDRFRLGGLTTSIMPTRPEMFDSLPLLFGDIRKALPMDITSNKNVDIKVPGVGPIKLSPFSWSIYDTTTRESSNRNRIRMVSRAGASFLPNELTIGISGETVAPESLEELWIRKSDFPIIIDDPLERRAQSKEVSLDLAKFAIITHMNTPAISTIIGNDLFKMVKNPLGKIKREYDPLGYGGLVDMDVQYGSPRNILHIAWSIARIDGSDDVGLGHLHEATDKYKEALVSTFNAWDDRDIVFAHQSVNVRLGKISSSSRKIYSFIMDNPNASRPEIRENFPKLSESMFNFSFSQLESLIYRPSDLDDRYSVSEY